MDDHAVARAARERGINLTPLSVHYRAAAATSGLILGYAAVEHQEAHAGLAILRDILLSGAGLEAPP
jgi:DNA-binding transcriptional MocR family regulator